MLLVCRHAIPACRHTHAKKWGNAVHPLENSLGKHSILLCTGRHSVAIVRQLEPHFNMKIRRKGKMHDLPMLTKLFRRLRCGYQDVPPTTLSFRLGDATSGRGTILCMKRVCEMFRVRGLDGKAGVICDTCEIARSTTAPWPRLNLVRKLRALKQ